jgi:hypothetical protein
MSGWSRYTGRADQPQPRDRWASDDLPDPNPDNFPESVDEWMWARSVQGSRLPHEVNDAEARAVLDAHDWRLLPYVHEPHVLAILNEELAAMSQARKARELPLVRALTPDDVANLRKRYSAGNVTFRGLSQRYGVSREAIRRAVYGLTWAGITDPPPCERTQP